MKKILFLIAPLFIALFACNDNKDKGNGYDDYKNNRNRDDDKNTRDRDDDPGSKSSVVGKWRIVDFESPDSEEMSEEERAQMTSSTVEFTRDGNFISSTKEDDGSTKKEYGTYEYDDKTKKLITVEEDGKREELEVRFSGRGRMTLTFDEGKVTLEKD